MIQTYYGNINTGQLTRLPYLGYLLLINLIAFGLMLSIGFAIGAGEHLIGGNLQQAQDMLREWFTIPFFIAFGIGLMLYFFAVANITAKRLRDMALPAWWVLLVIVALELAVAYFISKQASSAIDALFGVALILIPSHSFNRKN
jgi:uncharacterized membrane protein YhaH (DUF805 family)